MTGKSFHWWVVTGMLCLTSTFFACDNDGDGVSNELDNCPDDPNPGQADANGNGLGDACDEPQGVDTDLDGLADVLDSDDDNDGVIDGADPAPLNPNLCGDDNADTCDDCAAPPDADGDGACDFGDPCPQDPTDNCEDVQIINDCNGNPVPTDWLGDGSCDAGAFSYNGIPIYLNCSEFNCDEGDCTDCGFECAAGEIEDCNGNCAPAEWLGDGECDEGQWSYNGVPIFLNCAGLNNDNGDC